MMNQVLELSDLKTVIITRFQDVRASTLETNRRQTISADKQKLKEKKPSKIFITKNYNH